MDSYMNWVEKWGDTVLFVGMACVGAAMIFLVVSSAGV